MEMLEFQLEMISVADCIYFDNGGICILLENNFYGWLCMHHLNLEMISLAGSVLRMWERGKTWGKVCIVTVQNTGLLY
jgi:hypothetical protein